MPLGSHRYPPQCGYISPQPNVEPPGGLSQLSHYWAWIEVVTLALSMIVSIPDLGHTCMEPMETTTSNMNASGLTYPPQCGYISHHPNVEPPGGLAERSMDRGGNLGLVDDCKHP